MGNLSKQTEDFVLDLLKKELPKKVHDIIKEQYGDFEIVEVEEVDHHSKGLFYEVEFKRNGEKKDVEFSPNGQVLQ